MDHDHAIAASRQGTNQAPELKYSKVLYNRTATVKQDKVSLEPLQLQDLPPGQMYGIANVKLHGYDWTEAQLIVGGRVFDRILRDLGLVAFPALENGSCLPCCKASKIIIHITGKCDSVSFDVVQLDASKQNLWFTCKGYQTIVRTPSPGNVSIVLPFSFRVEKLVVKSAHPLSNIVFEISSNHRPNPSRSATFPSVALPFTYVSELNPTIDFSRTDTPTCRFQSAEKSETVGIIALYSNLFTFNKDVCGKTIAI